MRRAAKLVQHVPDMLRYRRAATGADVVHFEWLPVQPLDARLLPRGRPLVVTAHDVLPREARPGQRAAQRRLYERADAVVVHSHHGRERLVVDLEIDPERVHVIPHGAFDHLAEMPAAPLPAELEAVDGPVVLFFGLLRPYKGVEVLLDAWKGVGGAELWIVGMPRMPLGPLRSRATPSVRFVTRSRPTISLELVAALRRGEVVALQGDRARPRVVKHIPLPRSGTPSPSRSRPSGYTPLNRLKAYASSRVRQESSGLRTV